MGSKNRPALSKSLIIRGEVRPVWGQGSKADSDIISWQSAKKLSTCHWTRAERSRDPCL